MAEESNLDRDYNKAKEFRRNQNQSGNTPGTEAESEKYTDIYSRLRPQNSNTPQHPVRGRTPSISIEQQITEIPSEHDVSEKQTPDQSQDKKKSEDIFFGLSLDKNSITSVITSTIEKAINENLTDNITHTINENLTSFTNVKDWTEKTIESLEKIKDQTQEQQSSFNTWVRKENRLTIIITASIFILFLTGFFTGWHLRGKITSYEDMVKTAYSQELNKELDEKWSEKIKEADTEANKIIDNAKLKAQKLIEQASIKSAQMTVNNMETQYDNNRKTN